MIIHCHGGVSIFRTADAVVQLTRVIQQHNNALSQQAITRYGIAAVVPARGRVSFPDIAAKTPPREQIITRLLRHAITIHIFDEPKPGFVAHTKASKILADLIGNNWLGTGTEEMWPASTKVRIH